MCDQKHTSAVKISRSAAFNRRCHLLHRRTFILINTLGVKTHPDATMHQQPGVWMEGAAKALLCHTYQKHCSLCEWGNRVRLAFLSSSPQRSTNITLVLVFYSSGWNHHLHTLLTIMTRLVSQSSHSSLNTATRCDGRAIYWNNETRSASSDDHTRNTNMLGPWFFLLCIVPLTLLECLHLSQQASNYINNTV